MQETNQATQYSSKVYIDDNDENDYEVNKQQPKTYNQIRTTQIRIKERSSDNNLETIDLEHSTNVDSPKEMYFETEEPSSNNHFYYKRLGNCFAFFSNKNGDPLLIIGPHCI